MEKQKHYPFTKFNPEVISEAYDKFSTYLDKKKEIHSSLDVKFEVERWSYNSEEEFFSDYRRNPSYAHYRKFTLSDYDLSLSFYGVHIDVRIQAKSRAEIESVFEIFEKHLPASRLAERRGKKTKIFIGHGRTSQWRDLKDHLHDKHGYDIEAYEIGARAGHTIRNILEGMLDRSSFAILVFSGEDEDKEGLLHARENVIHELGLFQGRLGFSKAIVLLEEGTHEFSNIYGSHQIRYSKDNIMETFGEVLATLRREHIS